MFWNGVQCAEITKFVKEFCSKTVWMDRAFTIWMAKSNYQSADQFSSMKSNTERWRVLVLVKVAAYCDETIVFLKHRLPLLKVQYAEITKFVKEFCSDTVGMDRAFTI
jgi:hypothetical protein